jgi:PGF-CTERM protein
MIVVLAAGLLLLAALPASASAGLAGWQYQREIVIQENSGETLRDYQVLVALAGSDFPEEAQPDGADIRFTDADGVNLDYWIEEFDAGSEHAMIWVKVPLIPANGEAMVTMWYGNPGAESGSSGEAVFELFDDFDGISLDSHWNSGGMGSLDISYSSVYPTSYGGGSDWHGPWLQTQFSENLNNYELIVHFYFDHYQNGDLGQIEIELGDRKGDMVESLLVGDSHVSYDAESLQSVNDKNSGLWSCWGKSISCFSDGMHTWKETRVGSRLNVWFDDSLKYDGTTVTTPVSSLTMRFAQYQTYNTLDLKIGKVVLRKYTSPEPTVSLSAEQPASAITITKSPSPHSIRQFQETTISISIKNSGTTDATDIEITDAIHPSFDLTSGDFPNPKRYDLIRPGETRDLQYTISAKESGTFTLDPATVTYADEDGNIQEATSEPASIKVTPSTEGGTSGGTSRSNPSVSTASVQLHGEKTNVVLGEDILLKLSAVNLITKPTMHVQVIIIPPSGMSVTSSAFAKSGAGQYTTTYELEPGSGKDIEVAIRSNQVGEFDVNGRIIYYFGDDRDDAEDHTLTLPITVRAEPGADQTQSQSEAKESSTPGFGAVVAIIGLFAMYLRRKRA